MRESSFAQATDDKVREGERCLKFEVPGLKLKSGQPHLGIDNKLMANGQWLMASPTSTLQ
jgi:hypothetical protein